MFMTLIFIFNFDILFGLIFIIFIMTNFFFFMFVETIKERQIDDCNCHDDKTGKETFEAVAEIFLLQKVDQIRVPDSIRNRLWLIWSIKIIIILLLKNIYFYVVYKLKFKLKL